MSAYCYAIVALSTLLLIQSVFRFKGLYRVQAAVMLFGVLLPWVIEIIDMLRLLGFIPVDLVSMSFTVTGLTFLPALLRLNLLDLPPVAWAQVVERMNDLVVVIDPWGRIVNLNPAAERLIGRKSGEVTGLMATQAFRGWSALTDRLDRIGDHEESFKLDGPETAEALLFDARISPLSDNDHPVGWVLVLRDITEFKRRRAGSSSPAPRAGNASRGRGRKPGEGPLPGHAEPRAAHTADSHSGHGDRAARRLSDARRVSQRAGNDSPKRGPGNPADGRSARSDADSRRPA